MRSGLLPPPERKEEGNGYNRRVSRGFSSPGIYAWDGEAPNHFVRPLKGAMERKNHFARLAVPGVNAWARER